MFGILSKYFSNDMAIDLGTANTLTFVREQDQRDGTADAVGGNGPASAKRGERCHARKGDRHTREQRKPVAEEGLVPASENEGQHRQDAGAEDGEDAAEVGEEEEQHLGGLLRQAQDGRKIRLRPLMQCRLPVGFGPSSKI